MEHHNKTKVLLVSWKLSSRSKLTNTWFWWLKTNKQSLLRSKVSQLILFLVLNQFLLYQWSIWFFLGWCSEALSQCSTYWDWVLLSITEYWFAIIYYKKLVQYIHWQRILCRTYLIDFEKDKVYQQKIKV